MSSDVQIRVRITIAPMVLRAALLIVTLAVSGAAQVPAPPAPPRDQTRDRYRYEHDTRSRHGVRYRPAAPQWDPERLEEWRTRATAVNLGEGYTRTLDLQLSSF